MANVRIFDRGTRATALEPGRLHLPRYDVVVARWFWLQPEDDTLAAEGTGALVALGFFVPVAIIPAAAAAVGGYFVARSHAPIVARAQLALEQLLDRLERGDSPPRPNVISALDVWR